VKPLPQKKVAATRAIAPLRCCAAVKVGCAEDGCGELDGVSEPSVHSASKARALLPSAAADQSGAAIALSINSEQVYARRT